MISLGEPLPEAIRIGKEICPVRWDWHSCMRIILALESGELTRWEQAQLTVELLYKNRPPQSGEVYEKAVRFLNCGEAGSGTAAEGGARLYSFQKDASLIYSAFRQSHGIDLGKEPLHWWEFCWLFLDLREDCTFCRVVSLRDRRQKGLLSPEERSQAASLEGLLALPQRYDPEAERAVRRFIEAVGAGNPERS